MDLFSLTGGVKRVDADADDYWVTVQEVCASETPTKPPEFVDSIVSATTTPKPKSKTAKVLSFLSTVFVAAVILSFIRVRQTEIIRQQQLEQSSIVTTVWAPHPASGRMIPYSDVAILSQSSGYIKFRTTDGRVIEHSGTYQVQTSKRD